MKVKILEEKILDGRDAYFKDEVRTVPDDIARLWISAGWAEDVEGVVPMGVRKNKGEDLVIDTLKLKQSNKAV